MASILQKHAGGSLIAAFLSLVAALQGAAPCLARCHAARSETAAIAATPEAAVPACHASIRTHADREHAPIGSARISVEAASACCCFEDASGRPQSEAPTVFLTGAGSNTGGFFVDPHVTRLHRADVVSDRARTHGDLSPPSSLLFIAHHSLLI
jgi:hypothetical protein